MNHPLLHTVPEAAELLSVSKRHLYNLEYSGEIQFVRIGRAVRVRHVDVMRLAGLEGDRSV